MTSQAAPFIQRNFTAKIVFLALRRRLFRIIRLWPKHGSGARHGQAVLTTLSYLIDFRQGLATIGG
jgi:hypothetical protein